MRNKIWLLALALSTSSVACAQTVDYSVVSVPEETGADFMKITKSSDYVCMPEVKRFGSKISWLTNRIIDISKDGNSVAFLSFRNDKTNIFIKDLALQGSSRQRTNRSRVLDFSYSPDGKKIGSAKPWGRTIKSFLQTQKKDTFAVK